MYWKGLGLSRLEPWRDLARLQDEMNRLFQGARGYSTAADYPAVNAWVGENSVVLTAELPGIDPESIDISVVEDTITIKGERPEEKLPEGMEFHRRERGTGAFSRTFSLPYRVESDKVEANYDKGVLKLSLPRAEADKPRKIAVKKA